MNILGADDFVVFIVVLVLFLIGYVIYKMITDINGYGFFWLLVAIIVGQTMMDIPVKGNACWKDRIERLRKLVEKEKQDTL